MYLPQIALGLAIAAVTAAPARAQGHAPLPKNDVTVSIGWFAARYPGLQSYRWHQSLLSSAGAGHYWTEHFKSDVEAAWLSRVNADTYESEVLGDGTAYFRSTYCFQDAKLSFVQLYQFGENAWVHPYLGAGVDVDYLRSAEERPAQVVSLYAPSTPGGPSGTSRSISVPSLSERDTTVRARPFVKGGFKMYASDSAFFTTEWKVGLGDGVQHAVWKTGFGVDF